MGNDILVIAEQREGELKKVTFEILGEAKELTADLGGQVGVVVLGDGVGDMASTLSQYGASKTYAGDDTALGEYSPDGWATVIADLAERTEPAVILAPATPFGKDLAPRVAAKLGIGLASDVTGFEISDGRLLIKRPIYAGRAIATVRINTDPQMATVRANTFAVPEPDMGATADVEALDLAGYKAMAIAQEVITTAGEKLDIAEADIIVSGGRGMGGPENYDMLEELAAALPNAAVGASRASVDAGWRPHADQVGQTGKTVSPSLYIACGISGAVQHLAGMKTSKYIVAINKDSEAPIFKVADYGIVADLFDAVPKLTEEVKKLYVE
ncbi:MAG: Electron transfer flavoprotein subunit alpha [Anaerolineales bacterium]|nr:Electron transfer flavoprotein subunit alpha [Anaerolineales bacterium]